MPVPPIGTIYRPDKKWGVTDREWECWMVEMLVHYPAYQYEYNSYIISKVKTDVLAAIVPPEEISKSRTHRKAGSWVRKVGLDPDDRRPDYSKSLSTYGDLFFGSVFGYHREFEPVKGRRLGMAGSFIILWDLDTAIRGGKHPRCPKAQMQKFYNSLACVYALVEEAERRGDSVTFVVTPGDVENNVPWHTKPQHRRAPKGKMKFIYPSAKPYSKTGQAPFTDFSDAFNELMGLPVPSLSSPPDDGLLSDDFKNYMWAGVAKEAHKLGSTHEGELSKYYWWMNSIDYDDIKDEILNFMWYGHSIPTYLGIVYPLIQRLLQYYGDRKGTLVMVSPLTQMQHFFFGADYFKEMARQFNMYIIDVGNQDWTMMFKKEPLLLDDTGNPCFTYISLNTIFKISLTPSALIGYKRLEIDNDKTRLSVDFNGVVREFNYDQYPTAAALERGLQMTFPTLNVERLTSGSYKMEEADASYRYLKTPDGVITLTGTDLENLTYKILKVIGGTIDGVLVT